MSVRYSVLVATRNRASKLSAFFAALQPFAGSPDWELIIVDNGSADETAATVHKLAATLGARAKCLAEPRPGKARALNTGLRAAQGTVVVFTDDDCYLEPGYFDAMDAVFARPDVGYCGGRIVLHDPADAPMTIRNSSETVSVPPRSFLEPGLIQGANMAIRREVLERIGGFDEALGPGTPFISEDLDVVARASWAGWAGGYFPGPTVRHHHGRKAGAEVDSAVRGYDRGCGSYYAKFILRPDSRRTFVKHLYWHLHHVPSWGRLAREAVGAVQYLWLRLTR